MMYQAKRTSVLTLGTKSGNLAVLAGVVTRVVPPGKFGRVLDAQIALGTTGSVSGSTTVDIKKNGVSILTAQLSIAQGSATKFARTSALVVGPAGGGEPNGVDYQPGDVFTADISAVPGTTSTDLTVSLDTVEKDV